MVDQRKLWKLECGYADRDIISESDTLSVVRYKPEYRDCNLIGRRIIFFADVHYNGKGDPLCEEVVETINGLSADWVVFGGDLIRYSVYLDKALSFLKRIKANSGKIASYGNWDRRRRDWFPHHELCRLYSEAGFKLLINESFKSGGVEFYGIDDYKAGFPELRIADIDRFNCVISHSPDSIVDDRFTDQLGNVDLVLCEKLICLLVTCF